MIIILLREWNLFAPQPCPLLHFRTWSDELIKNFPLTGWLSGMWHTLSLYLLLSPSFSRWLAHSFTGKIASQRPTFRGANIGKRCNQQNWGKALYFVHFNSPMTSSVHSDILPVCVCVCGLRQGDCLIIRAESADRSGWETPCTICQNFITIRLDQTRDHLKSP